MQNRILKNVSYVMLANIVCMCTNITITFMIPIVFREVVYAYYQLENLYCGYLWILTLGWHEGIYIRYGGIQEEKIDKTELASQFWLFAAYLSVAFIISLAVGNIYFSDYDRYFVFCVSAISIVIEALRYVFLYFLICINSMQQYAKYMITDRVVYIVLVLLLIIKKEQQYELLLGADILSKLILLLWIICENRNFFVGKLQSFKIMLKNTKELIVSGINVTFASFVSRFVNGTVRLAVDACWGILVFGKISFTLSISNMFTQFIQALSVALFPELRRMSGTSQRRVYLALGKLLDAVMLFSFMCYLPGRIIIGAILPQYEESLRYLPILFPICLFDARNSILNITYLKTLHKEKGILISNIVAVVGSVICTAISVYVLKSLEMAVITILIAVAIRNYTAEIIVKREMDIVEVRNVIWELLMTLVFVITNWCITGNIGLVLYAVVLVVYYLMEFKNIKQAFLELKSGV